MPAGTAKHKRIGLVPWRQLIHKSLRNTYTSIIKLLVVVKFKKQG